VVDRARIRDGRRRIVVADEGSRSTTTATRERGRGAGARDRAPGAVAGTIFNVADGEALTVRQVVELCARELGADLEIVSMPYDLAVPAWPLLAQPLPTHRVLDVGRLHHQLGHRDVVPARVRCGARALARREPAGARRDRGAVLTDRSTMPPRTPDRPWLAARRSVQVPEFKVRPGWGCLQRATRPAAHARGVRRVTQHTGPLAGIKVLDLSIALTGPYAAALLADQVPRS